MKTGFLCAAVTARGYGCLNTAKDGPLCPVHDLRNRCGAPTAAGARCRGMKAFGSDRCSKHQG